MAIIQISETPKDVFIIETYNKVALLHEYKKCFGTKYYYSLTNTNLLWNKQKIECLKSFFQEGDWFNCGSYPNYCYWEDLAYPKSFNYKEPTELFYLIIRGFTIKSIMPVLNFLDTIFDFLEDRKIKYNCSIFETLRKEVNISGYTEITIYNWLIKQNINYEK